MPEISVIVPVYNVEQFLVQCVETILKQSFGDFELLLVDDGSTDDSGKICDDLEKADSRIKVYHKKNSGVGSARNYGIDRAKGKYLVFVDSDDWIEIDYLNTLYEKICENDNDCSVCGYKAVVVDNGDIVMNEVKYIPSFGKIDDRKSFENILGELIDKKYILSPWSKIYKTDILNNYSIRFDTVRSIGEDLLFNLQYFFHVKKIEGCNYLGYVYRISRDSSLTNVFGRERIGNTEELFLAGKKFCKDKKLENCISVFAKYYFKSHLNFLENRIKKGDSKTLIDEYISYILIQESMKEALGCKTRGDKELFLYQIFFRMRNKSLIKILCFCRIFAKKYVRGY
jgi:glycosyltransferase involved in cell wall biosynthesis